MTKTINLSLGLAIICGALLLTMLFLTNVSFGAAPSGLYSTLATTSQVTVGPNKPNVASTTVEVFKSSPNCASRAITTYASEIKLLFSNSGISSTTQNPSATFGHTQLASTTVVYDAEVWGCGYISAYGFSSTTLTISEFK